MQFFFFFLILEQLLNAKCLLRCDSSWGAVEAQLCQQVFCFLFFFCVVVDSR